MASGDESDESITDDSSENIKESNQKSWLGKLLKWLLIGLVALVVMIGAVLGATLVATGTVTVLGTGVLAISAAAVVTAIFALIIAAVFYGIYQAISYLISNNPPDIQQENTDDEVELLLEKNSSARTEFSAISSEKSGLSTADKDYLKNQRNTTFICENLRSRPSQYKNKKMLSKFTENSSLSFAERTAALRASLELFATSECSVQLIKAITGENASDFIRHEQKELTPILLMPNESKPIA